ncbi:MAG: protein translocase subunit SecF [Patescibacteria group bacterium]
MLNFMKFKWLYFLLSALVLVPGIFSLILFGLKPSIDFTGGSLLELKFEKPAIEQFSNLAIEETIKNKNFDVSSVQISGNKTVLIRLKPITKDDVSTIKAALAEKFEEMPQELRFETVGPILGRELLVKTLIAIILAAGFILGYVAWAFKDPKFGICAILAMFHDSFVLLGSFSLLGHFLNVEIDTLFVTAMLTILSFSVHDTVVVYDRIRESQKRLPQTAFVDLVNKAVTETLSRSLNNSLTIIFMLIALLLLGGVTIKWFVAALLIGTISGTYSSTFTAAPLLVIWNQIEERRKGVRK